MEQQDCDGWNPSSRNPVNQLKGQEDTEATEESIGESDHLVHHIEWGEECRVNPQQATGQQPTRRDEVNGPLDRDSLSFLIGHDVLRLSSYRSHRW